MVDKTDDKYAKLQRALKHVNKVQNSVDNARKKSGVDRIATDKHGNTVYKRKVEEMKNKDKAPSSSKQNPVAKHMRTFNKATVQRDRKKDAKRGYKKHSNAYENLQIDELSDDGLHSYISKSMNASDDAFRKKQKAHNNANNAAERGQMTRHKANKSAVKHFSAIQKKRDAGIQQALKKVTGRAKVNATESVEQVQESTGHVRMDNLSSSSQKKVVSLLKNHVKNGSIEHDGDTDKGASFKLLKPNHQSKIHSDLRKHGTGFDMHESVEQLAEDNTLTRDQLPKKVEAVVKKVFKVIDKYKKYRGTVSVEKYGTRYIIFIAVGRNGSDDEDYTGDLMSIIPWEKRKNSKIEIDVAASQYPAPKNIIIRESLDNAKTEKDSAQMKLRHANQKVRLAKKQEREKGAVAERKETDSAAKKPEKYTKADGTIGTRMVPAHKEVQTESAEQVDELSNKKLASYVSKASSDAKSRMKKGKLGDPNHPSRFGSKTDKRMDGIDRALNKIPGKKGSRDAGNRRTDGNVSGTGKMNVLDKMKANRSKGVAQKYYGEDVEQVDEGMLNDIRDFIVAVGAALPTKKNKRARADKSLEDQIRYAMQADPEFDKLVRNVVHVRKDGVAAFKNGGKNALRKYVTKTVDAEAAKKLGTLQTSWMKVKKDGTVGKAYSNTFGQKFKDEKGDPTKHKNVEDMYRTHIATTERIGKIIKRVAVRAQNKNIKEDVEQVDEAYFSVQFRDEKGKADSSSKNFKSASAAKKHADMANKTTKVGSYSVQKVQGRMESVEQVDENMFGYEGKNKIKIYHSDATVHKNAVRAHPDHHSAKFNKKDKTTTIHLKKSVDKDTASKIGRFDSNWKTRTSYHESAEYEDVIAEALSNVVVKKMQDMVGGPDKMPRGAEFRKLKAKAQAAVKAERSAKKAAPKAVTTTKTAKGKTHKGSADASERNIIMQLRKAQDLDGNSEVRISPKRSVKLSKKKIDALLKKHDSLQKPVQKRAYIVMLTKALRGMK